MDTMTNTISNHDSNFFASEMCVFCPKREITLFANMQQEHLLEMNSPIQCKVIEKGNKLYEHDEGVGYIYSLQDGVVKLEQSLPTGERRIVRLLRRGDLAGIEAIAAVNYQHDAIAMTKVSLCKIPVELVLEFSVKSQELHANLMMKWQDTLTTSDTWLTRFSTGNSRYRIVRLLIWLSENCHHEDFYMPGRKDIGNMLSLTTETVSRTIAEFRRDGILMMYGQDRARVNIARLKKIVKETV